MTAGVPQFLSAHLRRRSLACKLAAIGLVASAACSQGVADDPATSVSDNQSAPPAGPTAAAQWGRVIEGIKVRCEMI